MPTVNVHEAKTQLSRLLEAVEAGEDVVIARAGRPVARLVPVTPARRQLGGLQDRFTVPADWDAPLPDAVLADFHGRPADPTDPLAVATTREP